MERENQTPANPERKKTKRELRVRAQIRDRQKSQLFRLASDIGFETSIWIIVRNIHFDSLNVRFVDQLFGFIAKAKNIFYDQSMEELLRIFTEICENKIKGGRHLQKDKESEQKFRKLAESLGFSHILVENGSVSADPVIESPDALHVLPSSAPEFYKARVDRHETAIEFTQRVYGEWLGNGLRRTDIQRLDPPLWTALRKLKSSWPDSMIQALPPERGARTDLLQREVDPATRAYWTDAKRRQRVRSP